MGAQPWALLTLAGALVVLSSSWVAALDAPEVEQALFMVRAWGCRRWAPARFFFRRRRAHLGWV